MQSTFKIVIVNLSLSSKKIKNNEKSTYNNQNIKIKDSEKNCKKNEPRCFFFFFIKIVFIKQFYEKNTFYFCPFVSTEWWKCWINKIH